MGMFAPGYKELGDRFDSMLYQLQSNFFSPIRLSAYQYSIVQTEKTGDQFGFLGATRYIGCNERATNNDIMSMLFFKTADGLRDFAHSPIHREAWQWWNASLKSHPHLSIWHGNQYSCCANSQNIC